LRAQAELVRDLDAHRTGREQFADPRELR